MRKGSKKDDKCDNGTYDDDGGAAKDDGRRNRRQMQKYAFPALFFVVCLSIYYFAGGESGAPDGIDHRPQSMLKAPAIKRTKTESYRKESQRQHIQHELKRRDDIVKIDDDDVETNDETRHGAALHDDGKYRWIDPRALPPLPGKEEEDLLRQTFEKKEFRRNKKLHQDRRYVEEHFKVKRADQPPMEWEAEADDDILGGNPDPVLDYTNHAYDYPDLLSAPPPGEEYPPLEKLGDMFERWPQDEIDNPPSPIVEQLLHFDYSNPAEMAVAVKFRDLELPFKVYNVPELDAANLKWTDSYIAKHMNRPSQPRKDKPNHYLAHGNAYESADNFLAFFNKNLWNVETMGPPPTLDNDWNFETWAKHARYADQVQLPPTEPHYYWQVAVEKEERNSPKYTWTFISKDLPSFSNPEPTFFGFNPPEQKGIQCRFGERGIAAANHYDTGRNMVAMIAGAKRYILAPPKECSKLAIVIPRKHPAHMFSLLNWGHISLLDDPKVMVSSFLIIYPVIFFLVIDYEVNDTFFLSFLVVFLFPPKVYA
uniref:JmjC domain-containing protein n=1 Tax=Ditylum brightwellii TaxID=49249 RepID=A0A7S4RJI1_9STRA